MKIFFSQNSGCSDIFRPKISLFQISQEPIILGKKQRMIINRQKIPYKKSHVYFFAKIDSFPTVAILMKKIAKISQFFLQNLL